MEPGEQIQVKFQSEYNNFDSNELENIVRKWCLLYLAVNMLNVLRRVFSVTGITWNVARQDLDGHFL